MNGTADKLVKKGRQKPVQEGQLKKAWSIYPAPPPWGDGHQMTPPPHPLRGGLSPNDPPPTPRGGDGHHTTGYPIKNFLQRLRRLSFPIDFLLFMPPPPPADRGGGVTPQGGGTHPSKEMDPSLYEDEADDIAHGCPGSICEGSGSGSGDRGFGDTCSGWVGKGGGSKEKWPGVQCVGSSMDPPYWRGSLLALGGWGS